VAEWRVQVSARASQATRTELESSPPPKNGERYVNRVLRNVIAMERLAEARGATQELKASVPSTTITANSIPTAPTNILFIINNLWEVEGALGAVG
jgi:hypothetical protein